MGQKYYAHSLEGRPENKWQPLKEHLQNVAELAAKFAGAFGTEKWAYAAGLWHDLGKYSKEFQSYIIKAQDPDYSQRGPDHSSAGAQMAVDLAGKNGPGKLLAYAIAGHHAGLPNGKDNEVSCLAKRLEKRVPDYSAFPDALRDIQLPATLPFPQDMSRIGFQVSFFTRMLFSCLVDADFLDTEGFMDPKKSSWRQGGPGLDILFEKLSRKLENIQAEALSTPVNKSRSRILKHCLDAAEQSTGLFSLTVPTGGGKTLSSLAFGLKHAFKHGLKRVIYVIPYTSIIEQNARVFRDILGQGAVLEHHSNFDPPKDDRWSELAS
ncbi:MAG: CRISPR-associated endonuclease Cas3'', partial [Thermodesulfobacteriota bacterium]|nr:CRISPR-associated endonuclease Cas3'' [Thermodesulfobacteriota bacterium]